MFEARHRYKIPLNLELSPVKKQIQGIGFANREDFYLLLFEFQASKLNLNVGIPDCMLGAVFYSK